MFRQGIEPVRATPVFGKNRVSEFGHEVSFVGAFGFFVVFGGTGIAEFSGFTSLAEAESASGRAVVKSDKCIGLEFMHPLDGILVADATIACGVVHPPELDRTVVG